MIEWLASKIGVLIAIGVMTGFVLGIFAWEHSVMVDREGQVVADSVSRALDSVGGLDASTVLNISYGSENGQLPAAINGKPYTVNITESMTVISSGGRIWISHHVNSVVPRNLERRDFNLTGYEEADFTGSTGEHLSGEGFTVERATVDVSGKTLYMTMVYWE